MKRKLKYESEHGGIVTNLVALLFVLALVRTGVFCAPSDHAIRGGILGG